MGCPCMDGWEIITENFSCSSARVPSRWPPTGGRPLAQALLATCPGWATPTLSAPGRRPSCPRGRARAPQKCQVVIGFQLFNSTKICNFDCISDFLHGKESTKEPKEKKKHKFPKLPKLKSTGHKSEASAAAAAQASATTIGASRPSTASAPPLQTIDEVSSVLRS